MKKISRSVVLLSKSVQVIIVLFVFSLLLAVIPFAEADEDSWFTLTSAPTPRSGHGVAVVDGKIYVVGGTGVNTTERYNPATDTWSAKAEIPTSRSDFGVAVCQNKIYVIGGLIGTLASTGINEVYDPIADSWKTKSGIPTPAGSLYSFCANVVNDKIYLIGGSRNPLHPYDHATETLVYTSSNDSWTTKAPIPTPVHGYSSAVIDNKIYIIGGRSASGDDNLTQIYDTETDTWSSGAAIPVGSYLASAAATTGVLAPKRIYVFGGFTGDEALDSTYVYDPERDEWSVGAPLLSSRYAFGVGVVDDILYAIGGYNLETETRLDANDAYVPVGYSGGFVPPDYVSPTIVVDLPQNTTYTTSDVNLSFTVDEEASWMGYSLDEQDNVTVTENILNLTGLVNGVHNITVYATDTSGNTGASEMLVFTVAKEPESTQVEWTLIVLIVAIVAVVAVAVLSYFMKARKHQE